jgi:thiol:disulfide interchange protein DsbA
MKKLFTPLLALLASVVLSLAAHADTTAVEKYTAGKNYQILTVPVHTADANKIEVNEVFWYGCPHCFDFESILEPWAKSLPADVDFERTPAIWRPAMEVHARAYYTAKQLGVLDAMHTIIFKAMHDEKKALANENEVVALFANHGNAADDVRKAYESFSVQSQTRQGDARARSYGVEGTPEIIVNGKYRISTEMAGSQKGMLDVANFLIEKERQAMASKK